MESVYENLKNHFRRKLSCFRLELLGFDLLKGVAVVLFTFLLFLFFYAGLLSFFRLLPDFKYVLYLILFLLLGVEFFFFIRNNDVESVWNQFYLNIFSSHDRISVIMHNSGF